MPLTNSQYDEIMRTYEQTRFANRDKLLKRYDEVYQKIPELKDLDASVSTLSIANAKKMLSSDQSDLRSFKDKLQGLTRKRVELLTAHGYPETYLEPLYRCPDCRDSGYIEGQKCHCFKKAAVELLYTQSNLKRILQTENFSTLSMDYYSRNFIDPRTKRSAYEKMEMAVKTCHQFVEHFSSAYENLFITGSPGVGKTFLSNCIAKELIDHSCSVIYFTAAEFFELCKKHAFYHDAEAEQVNQYFTDCDLLIIDDLGTELANTFTNSQLFVYLNKRILQKKSTLISTNLSLDELKSLYGERIFSRISSFYTMIHMIGDDIRIQKKFRNREAF